MKDNGSVDTGNEIVVALGTPSDNGAARIMGGVEVIDDSKTNDTWIASFVTASDSVLHERLDRLNFFSANQCAC